MWRGAVTGAGKGWLASGGQAKESADGTEGANGDGSSVVRVIRRGSWLPPTAPGRGGSNAARPLGRGPVRKLAYEVDNSLAERNFRQFKIGRAHV